MKLKYFGDAFKYTVMNGSLLIYVSKVRLLLARLFVWPLPS